MGKSREEEHQGFLTWLMETIEQEKIDVLIVAGDIFDTGTPPNYARELYYNFLKSLLHTSCRYVIMVAGNHDSVSTLKAPTALLEIFNIFVITSGDEQENEVIEIYENEVLQGLVCAVPFLRDSVIRKGQSGETMSDKEFSLSEGIKAHYLSVYNQAIALAKHQNVPMIATGHLTTVGSKTSESEREIYIGGALDIDSDFLGNHFDYVALGHLHIHQKVKHNHVWYSGSPIALSFSEAKQQKKVNIVSFEQQKMTIKELDIPSFRPLVVLRGDQSHIEGALQLIIDKKSWIEIHLQDENPTYANQAIRQTAETLGLTILAIKIDKVFNALHAHEIEPLSLDEFTPLDIFERRLAQDEWIEETLKAQLIKEFKIIVNEVQHS